MFSHQEEPFCNPIAPDDFQHIDTSRHDKQNLSNDDFRKLLMTPRVGSTGEAAVLGSKTPCISKGNRKLLLSDNDFKKPEIISSDKKKKKKIYQIIKKEDAEEEDLLAELAKKYRDRAKERRDNSNPDYENEVIQSTMSYNAVPDLSNSEEAAKRRKQMIEESKFLGGDMKHTHLVKGLDYALLQKVKAEIEIKEEEELERLANEIDEIKEQELKNSEEKDWEIKSVLAQNIMKTLFKNTLPERNEYFSAGRMAYIFNLEESTTEDEVTIVIRSKAECPNWDLANSMSANDIIINKLIIIFTELRQQGGKRKKKDKNNLKELKTVLEKNDVEVEKQQTKVKLKNDINIYDDLDEYIPPDKRLKNDFNSSYSKSSSQKSVHEESKSRTSSSKNHHHYQDNNYRSEDKHRENYEHRRKEESSYRDRRSNHNDKHKKNRESIHSSNNKTHSKKLCHSS